MTAPKTREEAAVEIAQEILADPERTAKVVVAVIMAEQLLSRAIDPMVANSARQMLWEVLTK